MTLKVWRWSPSSGTVLVELELIYCLLLEGCLSAGTPYLIMHQPEPEPEPEPERHQPESWISTSNASKATEFGMINQT